jgi:hypothetical protein
MGGGSSDPVWLMLPPPGLEPALFSAKKKFVGEPDFRAGKPFERFTEKAEFFEEEKVAASDNEPGLSDFNDSIGSPGALIRGPLRKRITLLAMRIQLNNPVLGSSAIPLIQHLLDARHTL